MNCRRDVLPIRVYDMGKMYYMVLNNVLYIWRSNRGPMYP